MATSNNDSKLNYFLKLKEEYLFDDEIFEALMGMPNGPEYMLLYLFLCMLTRNSDGMLGSKISDELMIIYDPVKIARKCRYFSEDTVRVALGIYDKLGLVEQNPDGILFVTRAPEMVNRETGAAERKRLQRANAKEAAPQITDKKQEYAPGVKLTPEEYEKLIATYGEAVIINKIDDLSLYIGSTGKKYRSHYMTLRQWLKRDGTQPITQTEQPAEEDAPIFEDLFA